MVVNIYEPGSEDKARGIDRLFAWCSLNLSNSDDLVALDSKVARESGFATAVDDRCIANNKRIDLRRNAKYERQDQGERENALLHIESIIRISRCSVQRGFWIAPFDLECRRN